MHFLAGHLLPLPLSGTQNPLHYRPMGSFMNPFLLAVLCCLPKRCIRLLGAVLPKFGLWLGWKVLEATARLSLSDNVGVARGELSSVETSGGKFDGRSTRRVSAIFDPRTCAEGDLVGLAP